LYINILATFCDENLSFPLLGKGVRGLGGYISTSNNEF
jgi:hypothetical protein